MAVNNNIKFPLNVRAPMLKRQERHNEGILTALMSTESLVQQDRGDNHTHEGKPARAYNTMPQALPVGANSSSA